MKNRNLIYIKELMTDVMIFTGIFVFFIAITMIVFNFIN